MVSPAAPARPQLRLGLAALAVVAAVALSGGWTAGPDGALAEALRNAEGHPLGGAKLVELSRDVTALGSIPVLGVLTVLCVGGLLLLRRVGDALWAAVLLLGGWPLAFGLKLLWNRPRPEVFEPSAYTFTPSFPSAHAMLSLAVFSGVALIATRPDGPLRKPALAAAAFLALCVGFTRLHLGVHHPSDVLAGWLFATAWLLVMTSLHRSASQPAAHQSSSRGSALGSEGRAL